MKYVKRKLFIFTLIILMSLGCENKQSKDELVVSHEIEDKIGDRWYVNNSIDKFTNEDLSTALIKSKDKPASKIFEYTNLKFIVNKIPNKKNVIAYLNFSDTERIKNFVNYIEIAPSCSPKCEALVKFDGGETEKYTFKLIQKNTKIGDLNVSNFVNQIELSNLNKQDKLFVNKFSSASKVEIRFPYNDTNIDYEFFIRDKLDWN
jgi:hypothetical protein